MAPELAAAYVVGMIPSLALTALQASKNKRKIQSKPYLQLQKNLESIGKFWSDLESSIRELKANSKEKEQAKFQRTLWVSGLLFLFLSWAGFVFNLIIYISIYHLAITRFEQRIYASDLTKRDLSAAETTQILSEISPY